MKIKPPYNEAYGTWSVTTEADCEGRTTKHLGSFTGFIDEIAFHLADKCFYSLHFTKQADLRAGFCVNGARVNVTLDIDSGTWPSDMDSDQRAEEVAALLASRSVTVHQGSCFASVLLIKGGTPEEREQQEKLAQISKAKAKLTDKELELLGLK